MSLTAVRRDSVPTNRRSCRLPSTLRFPTKKLHSTASATRPQASSRTSFPPPQGIRQGHPSTFVCAHASDMRWIAVPDNAHTAGTGELILFSLSRLD